jgi:membrane protease YdiL (CAAX protease family)
MAQPARSRVQVLTCLVIVFAFSSFFYFLIIHSGSLGYGRGMYVFGLMWCPALAGMLTLRLNGRSISELGWKWGETKYQLRSWYIPILYASIAYAIIWIFHFGAFGNPEYFDSLAKSMHLGGPPWISMVLGIALIGTFGMVRSVSSALGEEIGWRGFLVPNFKNDFLHGDVAHQRHRVVALALSHTDFRGLQRRHSHVVWPHLLHCAGYFHEFCFCLDAPQIRQPLDRRDPPSQPQSLYPGHF